MYVRGLVREREGGRKEKDLWHELFQKLISYQISSIPSRAVLVFKFTGLEKRQRQKNVDSISDINVFSEQSLQNNKEK